MPPPAAASRLADNSPKTIGPPRGLLLASPGEKAQVSLFGVKAEGSKFVYVLDRSGSTGKLLASAKAEILASIKDIDDVHQFQLVVYNEQPKAFNPSGSGGQLAFGADSNRAEVKSFYRRSLAMAAPTTRRRHFYGRSHAPM